MRPFLEFESQVRGVGSKAFLLRAPAFGRAAWCQGALIPRSGFTVADFFKEPSKEESGKHADSLSPLKP